VKGSKKHTVDRVAIVISAVTALGIAYIGYLTTVANESARTAAQRTEVVAEKLDTSTSQVSASITQVGGELDKIHTLVNSSHGVQLRMTYIALERLAHFTKDDLDKEAASEAKRLYEEHMRKQKILDAKPPSLPAAQPAKEVTE
jgi:hypothetical protein